MNGKRISKEAEHGESASFFAFVQSVNKSSTVTLMQNQPQSDRIQDDILRERKSK